MNFGLKNKIALVTGASSGLGFAAAMTLAAEGTEVVINSRSEENLKKAALKIKEATGQDVDIIAEDLTSQGSAERIVAEILKKRGRIDILVSNAGGPPSGTFLDHDKEVWDKAVNLTLFPTLDLSRAVIPGMRDHGWGRLIFITSVSVKQPIGNLIISNTYRAAVTGFAKSISNEFASDGITVNTVCPGFTDTERLRELAGSLSEKNGTSIEDIYADWISTIPTGRIGKPEELASLIAYLASEQAAYINGTTIQVDGGHVKGLL